MTSLRHWVIRWAALLLTASILLAGCHPAPAAERNPSHSSSPTMSVGSPIMTIDDPTPGPTSTPEPTRLVSPTPAAPYYSGHINVFPGPEHYAGDVLTVEIPVHNMVNGLRILDTTVTIDGGKSFPFKAQVAPNLIHDTTEIVLPDLWETRGQEGMHTLRVQARLPRGVVLDVTTAIEIRPSDERPAQEKIARWVTRETECCQIHYVSGTAAERDIDRLAAFVEQSVTEVATAFHLDPQRFRLSFFFIDTVWGNGGYANKEGIVIYYVDRDFGPGFGDEILTTFRHEATHHAQWMLETAEAASTLNEGLAVYLGGGHYYTQPIPERTAALYRLGHILPLRQLDRSAQEQIHEAGYLQAAGLVAYLVETYGWEDFLQFYTTVLAEKIDNHTWETWLDGSLQENYGLSLDRFEMDFIAWLQNIDPSEQIDNLRLTLRLQDARRDYQYRHAPFLELYALGDLAEIEQLSLLTREASTPEAAAIETLIQSAQQAVFIGDFPAAEILLAAIEAFLASSTYDHPVAANYLTVARTLDEWGYEAQEINFFGDEVYTVVTPNGSAELSTLTLVHAAGDWLLAAD